MSAIGPAPAICLGQQLGVKADLHAPAHCLNQKKSKGFGNVWAKRVV